MLVRTSRLPLKNVFDLVLWKTLLALFSSVLDLVQTFGPENLLHLFFSLLTVVCVFVSAGSCTVRWENRTMYCVVSVFAVAIA